MSAVAECAVCCEAVLPGQDSFAIDAGFGKGRRAHEACRSDLVAIQADAEGPELLEPHFADWPDTYKPWIR